MKGSSVSSSIIRGSGSNGGNGGSGSRSGSCGSSSGGRVSSDGVVVEFNSKGRTRSRSGVRG